jgi:isocitrate dehydrogenase
MNKSETEKLQNLGAFCASIRETQAHHVKYTTSAEQENAELRQQLAYAQFIIDSMLEFIILEERLGNFTMALQKNYFLH